MERINSSKNNPYFEKCVDDTWDLILNLVIYRWCGMVSVPFPFGTTNENGYP